MGGKATRSTLSVPNHKAHFDGRNSVLPSIWDGGRIPVDASMLTHQTEGVKWDQNDIQLRLAQDQSEERRQQAQIPIAAYQQRSRASHHKKVKRVSRRQPSHQMRHPEYSREECRKARSQLGGPVHGGRQGRQRVIQTSGSRQERLNKQWNSCHLKRYNV